MWQAGVQLEVCPGTFGLGKYSRSRMSVWEMDCSGKGSVVSPLRNNFLYFWDLCFLLLPSEGRRGVGRGWMHLLNSVSACLSLLHLKLGVKIRSISKVRNNPINSHVCDLHFTSYSLTSPHLLKVPFKK